MLLGLLDPKVDKVQPDHKDLVEIPEYKYSFWYPILKLINLTVFNCRVKQAYRAQKDKKEYKELKYCSPLFLCA